MIRNSIIITILIAAFVALTANISHSAIIIQSTTSIEGRPINYPNPFKPRQSQTTKITYTLSAASDITIYIYDITGRMTKRLVCLAGQTGGKQGYNEVSWDGKTSYLDIAGNGVYYYFITFQNKVLGTGQIAVYD